MPHAHKLDVPLGDRRAYSLAEVAGLTGFAISSLYKLMHAGRLQTIKIAGKRLVTSEALDEFLGLSPPAGKARRT
jgi:archaeosine-15-forming tRNA-guanine transglycosylase